MDESAPLRGRDRLGELFEQAIGLPDEERAGFIARACGDDAELRAELESLLASHARAPGRLEAMAEAILPQALDAVWWDRPLVGQTVSHYHIEELIGGGGMGVVFRATDLSLSRQVALKLLRPHLTADGRARARLEAEARAASRLDHPNIAPVYEFGTGARSTWGGGEDLHFIAMAFCAGETIQEMLERGPLPVSQCLDIAAQVADALGAAHAAGVVHRDVKPANVIVAAENRVRVLDFGVARSDDSEPSRDGWIPGTVSYMSPEQTRGEPADNRSDIWSLGVLLYEMLSGRRPFRGQNDALIINAIRNDPPEPLRVLRPTIPPHVAHLIEGCLQKNPRDRFGRAADLAAALRSGASDPASDHAPMSAERHRAPWPAFAAGGVVIVLLLALAVRGDFRRSSSGLEDLAANASVPGAALPDSTDSSRSSAAHSLLRRASGYPYGTREGNQDAYELLERSLALDSMFVPAMIELAYRAYLMGLMGLTSDRVTALEKAEQSYNRALSIEPDNVRGLTRIALLYLESGRIERTLEPLHRAFAIDANSADALQSLLHVYRQAGLFEEAEHLLRRARTLDPTSLRLPSTGLLYFQMGRYDQALELFRLDPGPPLSLVWQGLTLLNDGNARAASTLFERAVARDSTSPAGQIGRAVLAYLDGNYATGSAIIQNLEARADFSAAGGQEVYFYARLYCVMQNEAGCARLLREAIRRDFFPHPFIDNDPFLEPVRHRTEIQKIIDVARIRHETFRSTLAEWFPV